MGEPLSNIGVFLPLSIVAVAPAESYISRTTECNWRRLGTEYETKLVSRANKTLSKKRIIPVEYFSCPTNIEFAMKLVALFQEERLNVLDVVVAVAKKILQREGLLTKPAIKYLLETTPHRIIDIRAAGEIDGEEDDLLGGIYQALLPEGERNLGGIYYTKKAVAEKMTNHCPQGEDVKFLDPCCGGGMMFKTLKNVLPQNIYGIDRDPIAVFIAKINLIRWFSSYDFEPNIFCADYLNPSLEQRLFPVFRLKYDAIATNPPWGADGNGKETFDLFYRKAFSQLKEGGMISFLFPQSIMSVAAHRDLRDFILSNGALQQITQYAGLFSGVTTKYVGVIAAKTFIQDYVIYDNAEGEILGKMKLSSIVGHKNLSFDYIDEDSAGILTTIEKAAPLRLENRGWALGIVTGDNKNKLSLDAKQGWEPIYTGKEVSRYVLSPPKNFILFDRSKMQQVAKDEYYRANEKLIYRFICSDLRFSYDNTGALTLNSANVLVPYIEGMSVKCVMAFLNSKVLNFYYRTRFGSVKVLKSNLLQLPFPRITKELEHEIVNLVDRVLEGDLQADAQIQDIIMNCYDLTMKQIRIIKENINGKVD